MDKGLKILLDYYWDSNGWKDEDEQTLSAEDFAIAKSEGYMFDNAKRTISHAETLQRLSLVVKKIDPSSVANVFLYSLSTRRLEYRSALGSYWYAISIPMHEQTPYAFDYICPTCSWHKNIDLNCKNFVRYKFGGVGHDSADYALFDLEQFLNLPAVTPTQQDKDILKRILCCIDYLSDTDKAGKLRDRIVKERIFKTNKNETQVLLDILGICGVLSSEEFPCFCEKFVSSFDRAPVESKSDFYYPVNRWRKKDGINTQRFLKVFGWNY